jgi:16S rRNA (guanine(1405)-N(7))-methyltransferase
MNVELEKILIERVSASKAGREVDPGVVRSAVRWALARHTPKDAEKAAKSRLHQFYGSYVGEGWAKDARRILSAMELGEMEPRDAVLKLLSLHNSTKERLTQIPECYDSIFDKCGLPGTVLDIACGLNPLSFYLVGQPDISLLAQDAGSEVVEVLNRFFAAAGMGKASAEAGDALKDLPNGQFDLALVMKFLPLCERMEKDGALTLMNSINARHIVVSFPTRSLSGRNVGMERNYSEWFEGLGFKGEIVERFLCGNEVFYIVAKK